MAAPRKTALAEESAEVEVLFANMEKLKGLTKKIQASLTRMETSAHQVQEAIRPIYGNTQRLQIVSTNVDRLLEAIDRIQAPQGVPEREMPIINAGVENAGLADFIASLDRCIQALTELKRTNFRSSQEAMAVLKSLLRSGTTQLEDVFRELLVEEARPVEPLHYITKQLKFPVITPERSSQLRTINSHIAASSAQTSHTELSETPSAKIYAEIRGEYITSTLRNLASASMNTAKKTSADALYRQGANGIGTYASGLEGLYLAEYECICPVFPREDWGRVYSSTCQASLDEFSKTLQALNEHVKANLITDCFLAYEIIDIVSHLSLRLETQTGELKRQVADSLKPIRETAKHSLRFLIDDMRRKVQGLIALPIDGGSSELTAQTMTRLQNMTNYVSPLSSIMVSLGDGGWGTASATTAGASGNKPIDVGADGRQLFASYATEMIETLLRELEAKGRILHKGRSLQGVFLANNVAVVERMIRSSELQSLLADSTKTIEAWRTRGTKMYLEALREPSSFLLDVQYTNRGGRPQSGSAHTVDSAAVVKNLSSKDKDAIKEKWKGFNACFDELLAKHKSYGFEREVRSELVRDVQNTIEPLYGRFWDRYHEIDKGRGKYVKYDKAQLNATLQALA